MGKGNGTSARQSWTVWLVTLGVIVLGCVVSYGVQRADAGTAVEMPSAADGAALAASLDAAYRAQGVCYGWQLRGGSSSEHAVGSNFGAGVALDRDALPSQCGRAVELIADVTYTSPTSEVEDYAWVDVDTVDVDLPYDVTVELERFGVTQKNLMDDPVAALARGVLALPLLVAEHGLAAAVPRASDSGTATGAAPVVGSDFIRDRGWLLITAMLLLLCVPVGLFAGFASRRRAEERAHATALRAVSWRRRAAAERRRRRKRGRKR